MPSMNFFSKRLDSADPLESRHRTAQRSASSGVNLARDDGKPHGLLLEQRDAQGLSQNGLQLVRLAILRRRDGYPARCRDRAALRGAADRDAPFFPGSAPAARSRPRSRGRRIFFGRSAATSTSDAAFDSNTPIVSARTSCDRPLARRTCEQEGTVRLLTQYAQIKGPPIHDRCQGQHIHLQNFEIVEIVLVPFDYGSFIHGGIIDGHDLVEARRVMAKPPTCWDRWRGNPIAPAPAP